MDYEKKYKEALERARKLKENPQMDFYEYSPKEGDTICDYIFPELKESEDEMIRKKLIEFVKVNIPDEERYIAWLEKQGEQKPIVDGILTATNYDKWFQNCKLPKFKVGDWVVFIASENVYQVEKIENYEYTLRHILGGSMPLPFSSEELIRPWTIKDAKPGDVLASGQLTFIFKVIHGAWLNCHCSAHNDGSFIVDSYDLMTNKYFSEVHPATKEQRDTLTKAMANAGWEFDFDKKELRKIEQNLASSAKNCKDA